MKLFAIKDTTTRKLLPNLFFETKVAAKHERDRLNTAEDSPARYVVTPGPDHWRFNV